MPLPTTADMVDASRRAFMLEMNTPQERAKPRASGIGDCARKQAYSMRNVGATNEGNRDGGLTTEQGREIEDLTVEVIRWASGGELVVANRQIELPADFPMTGHPDGQIVNIEDAKWNPDCGVCGAGPSSCAGLQFGPATGGHLYGPIGWEAPLDSRVDGQVTGFEHKHLGNYGFQKTFKEGFAQGEPTYFAQTLSYGDALGWDRVRVVVLAQDSSVNHRDAQANLKAAKPKLRWAHKEDWHPKLQQYDVDLGPMLLLQKKVRQRAEWLTGVLFDNAEDPGTVVREADPNDLVKEDWLVDEATGEIYSVPKPDFPCGWCPWLQRCLDDGPGKYHAPKVVA